MRHICLNRHGEDFSWWTFPGRIDIILISNKGRLPDWNKRVNFSGIKINPFGGEICLLKF